MRNERGGDFLILSCVILELILDGQSRDTIKEGEDHNEAKTENVTTSNDHNNPDDTLTKNDGREQIKEENVTNSKNKNKELKKPMPVYLNQSDETSDKSSETVFIFNATDHFGRRRNRIRGSTNKFSSRNDYTDYDHHNSMSKNSDKMDNDNISNTFSDSEESKPRQFYANDDGQKKNNNKENEKPRQFYANDDPQKENNNKENDSFQSNSQESTSRNREATNIGKNSGKNIRPSKQNTYSRHTQRSRVENTKPNYNAKKQSENDDDSIPDFNEPNYSNSGKMNNNKNKRFKTQITQDYALKTKDVKFSQNKKSTTKSRYIVNSNSKNGTFGIISQKDWQLNKAQYTYVKPVKIYNTLLTPPSIVYTDQTRSPVAYVASNFGSLNALRQRQKDMIKQIPIGLSPKTRLRGGRESQMSIFRNAVQNLVVTNDQLNLDMAMANTQADPNENIKEAQVMMSVVPGRIYSDAEIPKQPEPDVIPETEKTVNMPETLRIPETNIYSPMNLVPEKQNFQNDFSNLNNVMVNGPYYGFEQSQKIENNNNNELVAKPIEEQAVLTLPEENKVQTIETSESVNINLKTNGTSVEIMETLKQTSEKEKEIQEEIKKTIDKVEELHEDIKRAKARAAKIDKKYKRSKNKNNKDLKGHKSSKKIRQLEEKLSKEVKRHKNIEKAMDHLKRSHRNVYEKYIKRHTKFRGIDSREDSHKHKKHSKRKGRKRYKTHKYHDDTRRDITQTNKTELQRSVTNEHRNMSTEIQRLVNESHERKNDYILAQAVSENMNTSKTDNFIDIHAISIESDKEYLLKEEIYKHMGISSDIITNSSEVVARRMSENKNYFMESLKSNPELKDALLRILTTRSSIREEPPTTEDAENIIRRRLQNYV